MDEYIEEKYHVEVGTFQINHSGEKICGDIFLSTRLPDENRVLAVLSDGMGHGVKANVLATLTATIAMNLSEEHKEPAAIAEKIMKALPVCSERQISYATYTIADISLDEDTVTILEYDNPRTIIIRGRRIYEPNWENVQIENANDKRERDLRTAKYTPQLEDRIIICSDGITMSGLGMGLINGWGRNDLIEYIRTQIESNPTISARSLSEKIVKKASANDLHNPKDDLTCSVIYFRQPRRTLLCTGPPFNMERDPDFAQKFKTFAGRKIISGATTSEIIARELRRSLVDEAIVDDTLPPSSKMEGVDLVTEGVLTLSKAIKLLETLKNPAFQLGKGPADQICEILLDSDEINILVGTKINESHHDPSLPVVIEIRRNLIQRLQKVLCDKYMKVVKVEYM
ncbi:MAG: SpoIIE family protein phosphatase [Bacteroidales bacterium]|jgi:hypothetical protein